MRMIKEAIQKPEINFWLSLIIPVIGIAVAWGVLNTRVEYLSDKVDYADIRFQSHVDSSEKRFDEQNAVFLDIQVKLAEIQKDIAFIKQQLD